MRRKTTHPPGEGRRVYGFVEAVEPPLEGNKYSRFALMLDAVDAMPFDEDTASIRERKNLSIIRIISTQKRFSDLFNINTALEGKWLQLTLGDKKNAPPAWILNASDDYLGSITRTNVLDATAFPSSTEASATTSKLLDRLEKSCIVAPRKRPTKKIRPPSRPPARLHIRVIDVGHASCAAIHTGRNSNSQIIGYFDAGAPAFFHSQSFPRNFGEARRVPDKGFVILSHWDFDHYALAVTHLKSLKTLDWYAPRQTVGPNAAALQRELQKRLHFIENREVSISNHVKLIRGTGAADDRNNSGYALRLEQRSEKILLTADIGYDYIETAAKRSLTGLSIPHHGGNGSANPPRGSGVAAVSYGLPNRYRHPREDNLIAHCNAGWSLMRTATHDTDRRGDRWLTSP